MFLILVLVVYYGFVIFAGALLYLIYFPFKRHFLKSGKLTPARSRQITKTYIYVLLFIPVIPIYLAFYPNDEFYEEEFKRNTGMNLPLSANIIKKTATYPDFQGEYSSSAIVKLDKNDCLTLKSDISKLEEFRKDTNLRNYFVYESLIDRNTKEQEIETIYSGSKREWDWFRIIFLKDRETIIFEKRKS